MSVIEIERKTLAQRIIRAGVVIGIAHALFKLAGLFQAIAMGRYLPGATYDSVYAFAFEGCIFSLFLIGEEVIGPSFLPVFMREYAEKGDRTAWRFANTILTLQVLILIPVVATLILAPGWVVGLLTEWTVQRNAEQIRLGRDAVQMLAPALFGLTLGSTTYVILNGYKRFFLAAFGDAVWKFTAVAGVLGGVLWFGREQAVYGLLAGLLLGSVLKLATHLIGLHDKAGFFRLRLHLNDPAVRAMLWLALPLLAGILFAKVRDVFNNVYILSPLDAVGLMQANSMGRKLQGTIHWMVPYTLSIAAFPFFCELVDRKDHVRLGEVITRSGRMLLAVFIPFSVVMALVSVPLTSLVFKGGEFQELAVVRTALSTACYTFVLPAAAVEALVMQAFFAHRRTTSVVVVGVLFSAFSMAVSWAGLRLCQGNDLLLLGIIAGGFALSRTLKSVALVGLLRTSTPVFPLRPTLLFLARVGLASLVAGAGAWVAMRGTDALPDALHAGRKMSDLIHLAAGGAGGLAGGVAGALLFGVREPFEMVRWAIDKYRGRLKRRFV
jgi:peptidoglycan biosynthesis protein MviN/MurJ (putative lipid II flippase)